MNTNKELAAMVYAVANKDIPPAALWDDFLTEHPDAEDVRGKVVYGNIPLHLAALAAKVVAIEFDGDPPRGREYTLDDMLQAGDRLVHYGVLQVPSGQTRDDFLNSCGFGS